MATSIIHAKATARHLKAGTPEDYLPIHKFIDSFKSANPDIRHRAFLHNSMGPFIAEEVFGPQIEVEKWPLGSGVMIKVPTREIVETHIIEDLGWIPSPADWASCMDCAVWMGGKTQKFVGREEILDSSVTVKNPTREDPKTGSSNIFDVEKYGTEGGPRGMVERRKNLME